MQPKPKLESFETLEAYLEALIDWKFEQRICQDSLFGQWVVR
jgi:hypothetical protein